jgi:hypothetical protein
MEGLLRAAQGDQIRVIQNASHLSEEDIKC